MFSIEEILQGGGEGLFGIGTSRVVIEQQGYHASPFLAVNPASSSTLTPKFMFKLC
jgi:hypothetical protein